MDEARDEPTAVRVILVDDDAAVLNALAGVLERLGADVARFREPLPALSHFTKKPLEFDLVVSDQDMPGLTGQQMLARMRALRPDLVIALCSGRPIVDLPERCYALRKPFSLNEATPMLELARLKRLRRESARHREL